MADFNKAVEKTLKREGGARFTNDPDDPGRETKYGISQKAYPDVNIENLTEERAKEIYKRDYWNRINGDGLMHQAIAEKLFDTAVNIGVKTASRLAQATVGEKQDGSIGPRSRMSINLAPVESFLMGFTLFQIAYYCQIVRRRPKSRKYLLGWITRALGEV